MARTVYRGMVDPGNGISAANLKRFCNKGYNFELSESNSTFIITLYEGVRAP